MRKLSETFVFKSIDSKNHILDNIKNINLKFDQVHYSELEDQLRIIARRFNYGLKNPIFEAIENEDILFIYPENVKLTKMMPVYLANVDGKAKAIINIKIYASKDRDDKISIDPRTLFALLQSAFLALNCNTNWNKISLNSNVLRLSAAIYVKMFNKVLDKMFGINLNTIKSDKINYLIAKFFLLYIVEKEESEVTDNLALNCVFNKTDPAIIKSIESDANTEDMYSSLEMIIILLSKQDGLSRLTMRTFLENWMIMFGESTAFAIEYLPSMYEAIFAAMVSARINRDSMFENLVGSEMSSLYTEFSRILR